jgi:hypothetical protein
MKQPRPPGSREAARAVGLLVVDASQRSPVLSGQERERDGGRGIPRTEIATTPARPRPRCFEHRVGHPRPFPLAAVDGLQPNSPSCGRSSAASCPPSSWAATGRAESCTCTGGSVSSHTWVTTMSWSRDCDRDETAVDPSLDRLLSDERPRPDEISAMNREFHPPPRLVRSRNRPSTISEGPRMKSGNATPFRLGHYWATKPPDLAMRMRGLEPPRGRPHTDLNRARLPIPPHPRGAAIVAVHLRQLSRLLDVPLTI